MTIGPSALNAARDDISKVSIVILLNEKFSKLSFIKLRYILLENERL